MHRKTDKEKQLENSTYTNHNCTTGYKISNKYRAFLEYSIVCPTSVNKIIKLSY